MSVTAPHYLIRMMMYSLIIAALIAASIGTVPDVTDLIDGNWYSNAVDSLVFTNWGIPGTYQEVINMTDGQCVKTPVSYGGGMAPLNEEVSLHFRGPMHLKSFAFYTPTASNAERDTKPSPQNVRHDRGRGHAHAHIHEDRNVGSWVTATINGQVVSWVNQYAGPSVAPYVASNPTVRKSQSTPAPSEAFPAIMASLSTPTPALQTIVAEAGSWSRQAYYNATSAIADGLVFLNNHGGEDSGIFDYDWGTSLSYASPNSQAGADDPQTLADTLLDDQVEVIIYTDKQCEGDSCGFYRPGSVAYHGFDGNLKLFLMEFDMPHQDLGGTNSDMPAIWILNAAISRTQQYGTCSCWPGCGEWDIFEILNSGSTMAKSTLHADAAGGPSQYFERPVNQTMKAAVLFDGSSSSGYIFVLPDDTEFDTSLTQKDVADLGGSNGAVNDISADFVIGS